MNWTNRAVPWVAALAIGMLAVAPPPLLAQSSSVSGSAVNDSTWDNLGINSSPPGDGTGAGRVMVGLWSSSGTLRGRPLTNAVLATTATLPFLLGSEYAFSFVGVPNGDYLVAAWIDGDGDGGYDPGEPISGSTGANMTSNSIAGLNVTITDDSDGDGLPDYWEAHWFSNLDAQPGSDDDKDGLLTEVELVLGTNPAHFDTDGDQMDDAWEVGYRGAGGGLDPVVADGFADRDGDGLLNIQEYNGVDGKPRMVQDPAGRNGVGKLSTSKDDLNPLVIDTDGDTLIDSFEAAWYDVGNGIDPNTAGSAAADPDQDGLSNYREQCLLLELRSGGALDAWTVGALGLPAVLANGFQVFTPKLLLGASSATIFEDIEVLRGHGWTDPGHGSDYPEFISPNDGWDTDEDELPDGWEVEFRLDPQNGAPWIWNGVSFVINPDGFWGDPDGDTLVNIQEYYGQDGERDPVLPYIWGTGDESNPNVHNWRPLTTFDGSGISRQSTLGGALPTVTLGSDRGADSDDDGIVDAVEIQMESTGGGIGCSPVHSMHPFVKRAALITSAGGIVIPDPEGNVTNGFRPELHSRDWVLECRVKIRAPGRSGALVRIPSPLGLQGIIPFTCELALSNDVPSVGFATAGAKVYRTAGLAIPTGQWVHVAGVWDHANNSLGLYMDGVFLQETRVYEECVSRYPYYLSTNPVIGQSPAGVSSFANQLLIDEVRLWNRALTGAEVEQFRRRLAPQSGAGLAACYRFDDGGFSIEDFSQKAKNGLLASSTEYTFGDFGYAPTGSTYVITNDAAEVLGVESFGADDSDSDGMDDAWEMINHLNWLSAEGTNGPAGDLDQDGLANIYEYWSRTNPQAEDTDQNGILDELEDLDGDTVPNGVEQILGSRPDRVDTDDDGLTDREEQLAGSSPIDPADPFVSRALTLGGAAADFLEVPTAFKQRLKSWSLEAWVNPQPQPAGAGAIIRRAVQRIGGESFAINYVLGLEASGGALVPYAGYVTADGTTNYIRAAAIPAGSWTHLAATFDGQAIPPSLAIYTNGVRAAVSNGFFKAAPANGKGGETSLLIGPDYQGLIDEVRIWDGARTAAGIASNYTRVVGSGTPNLIHYFRFDDGEATTNTLPFGEFHQPHSAQDFTYEADWNDQWIHAAVPHGSAAISAPGAVLAPPVLTINLQPAAAVGVGAAWSVDGGPWNASGTTLRELSPGQHAVTYRSAPGWSTPSNETVNLAAGAVATLTRSYVQDGALVVSLEPAAAQLAGALWRVDGGGWMASGTLITNVPAGPHTVEFTSINGWVAPPTEAVFVPEGGLLEIVRTYVPAYGDLTVTLEPSAARADGALWRVDGGAWQPSGATNTLPIGPYLVDYSPLTGWIHPSNEIVNVNLFSPVALTRVYVLDTRTDTDGDGLVDSWEVTWFGDLSAAPAEDPDNDGLTNQQEHDAAIRYPGLGGLSPLNWDSDGDLMDDKWEYARYLSGAGLNPTVDDGYGDVDGDGLPNVQEYFGVDALPILEQDPTAPYGVAQDAGSTDALNPLSIDSDDDGLIDSFEAAWYDPSNGIDPLTAGDPAADPDEDGLSNYREQCLLAELREGGDNDIWSDGPASLPRPDAFGIRAFAPRLDLRATNWPVIAADLPALRGHEWTDPSAGSGYTFETPVSGNDGWDTDGDLLPDGWEVEFNLDPRSGDSVIWNGSAWVLNPDAFWGDPDGDGLMNTLEYYGQDGNRASRLDLVNGTGDETNPNEHNWRPDSTGPGPGTSRPRVPDGYWFVNAGSPTTGTMGGALPTLSVGSDAGDDTDDDGIPDDVEIQQEFTTGIVGSSPVHSMDPFVRRAALITSSNGIAIPDPEGSLSRGYAPLLHGRDWTVECHVKLTAPNCTGYLVDNPGPLGAGDISYRLELSNNIPRIGFHTMGGMRYVVEGLPLPTGRWVHVAGVWSHSQNALSLYVDGIFLQQLRVYEEGLAGRMYPSAEQPTIGRSPDGSFANNVLMDEIRIWAVARSGSELDSFRGRLVPPDSAGLRAYYRFDDGGATAEDFTRKAQNGLLGASSPYTFGDFGYALPTNGFRFVSSEAADVRGVDAFGADDSDGDGMPDAWESINHLDPTNSAGAYGPAADLDGDGLSNLYEYWGRTNPHEPDTDADGVLDSQEDLDGDGLTAIAEQTAGTRPDMADTDDDGLTDARERADHTDPLNSVEPLVPRAIYLPGAAADYVEVPVSFAQRLTDWTVEAWVTPSNAQGGYIVRRVVQTSPAGQAMNYVLGLAASGADVRPYAGYVMPSGSSNVLYGASIPVGQLVHLAASYSAVDARLTIYANGSAVATSNAFIEAPPINGKAGDAFLRIGESFAGLVDDVRIWSRARTDAEIQGGYAATIPTPPPELVHYFRFDDREATTNELPYGPFHVPSGAEDFTTSNDWQSQWVHAARLRGQAAFVSGGATLTPPSIQVILEPAAARTAGALWRVDGGAWLASGSTNVVLVGNHFIDYSTVNGWTKPTGEVVALSFTPVVLTRVYVVDLQTDSDKDGLADSWEMRWFGDLDAVPSEDPDKDGLTNQQEHDAAIHNAALNDLSPLNWDSDGDLMDDKWELDRYFSGIGLNPALDDGYGDADGDGLANVQEYFGIDEIPILQQDPAEAPGVARSAGSTDALNPMNVDTDDDGLIDSFEAAWYDPTHQIDPLAAGDDAADTDLDGLSNYREQCLLAELREGASNDIWSLGKSSLPARDSDGNRIFAPKIDLRAVNAPTIIGDLTALRGHEWTDPSAGSGFTFETPVSGSDGWDTDGDLLPDGWEVEFNLDPRSGDSVIWNGSAWVLNPDGFWGDPDGDGLMNTLEYYGQDGNRASSLDLVNGTGDETNPNEHNWRPDSTGAGPGTKRPLVADGYWSVHADSPTTGTMGGALPTLSLGVDTGEDTDDDGITDDVEIQQEYTAGIVGSSPVHSMDPFVRRAALITSSNGIAIPDPEGSLSRGYAPLLHGRDWTVECHVKLTAPNCTGYLVDDPGPMGAGDISFRLELSNNVPRVGFHTMGGLYYAVEGLALPTGRWVHVAGVWSHSENALSLYVDGIFLQQLRVYEESLSGRMYASAEPATIGRSPDASFVNNLLIDEVRIWAVARSGADLESYRARLVAPSSAGLRAYYRFDDGGATAEDFTRKAQNGLLGASSPYTFGDFGYALPTNGFRFVSNDVADVRGVDAFGADDSDGDGMPDAWESINHLDPTNAVGAYGASADLDGDGLSNLYEYWGRTNPRERDTDADGVLDSQEDLDGDGLTAIAEQTAGTRPDMADTDDDGFTDARERADHTSPLNSVEPLVARSIYVPGGAADYAEVPVNFAQRLTDWTVEAWVTPSNAQGGYIVRRVVQTSPAGQAMNYVLGLAASGADVRPYAGYVMPSGASNVLYGAALPVGQMVHLAAAYSAVDARLTVYANGSPVASSNTFYEAPPINGKAGDAFLRIGESFAGLIDDVRIWSRARTDAEILGGYAATIPTPPPELVHYFRFDDREATTNELPYGPFHVPSGAEDFTTSNDWQSQWIHAARLRGGAICVGGGATLTPPSIQVMLEPAAARAAGALWRVDGGPWLTSGSTNVTLAGAHTIDYSAAGGWTAPTSEVVTLSFTPIVLTRTYVVDLQTDSDKDGLADSWEMRWFGNLDAVPSEDPDKDGLTNQQEHDAAIHNAALNDLSPLNWDSDGDLMDDKWELDRYFSGIGLNPALDDGYGDADGDGLANVQEYFGIDEIPILQQDPAEAPGVARSAGSTDALNPMNVDTDDDGLIDSFEAAWYDPTHQIDPLTAGDAAADTDLDGLSNYREQCLLAELREGASNDIWSLGKSSLPTRDSDGNRIFAPKIDLRAVNAPTIIGDLTALRGHEWTDPSAGSGFTFETPVSGSDGWDTDGDLLPDGWEVEFNLDPRSGADTVWNGSAWVLNPDGFWGDPDGDGLMNTIEYYGQDGNRATNRTFVNGTGDETNPNEHNWRPDSTGPGPATKRPLVADGYWNLNPDSPTNGTLGAALPTVSLGADWGADTDDDGLRDDVEIQQEYTAGIVGSSPAHSMDPFIRRAALITSSNGIAIPDPEGSQQRGYAPLLHGRDWTVECCVKLASPNCSGYLVDNPGPMGMGDVTYRLELSNNVPRVGFHTMGGMYYAVQGLALPTGRWVHVAAVWSHSENALSLYVDGIFLQQLRVYEEGLSGRMYASAEQPAIGRSPDGSFVNNVLIDEVRIWTVSRTGAEVEQYRARLVPPASAGLRAYYRFDDGGATAEDFTRKAQNGLLGATSPYTFGDFGYALQTNGFRFVSNDVADVRGVDAFGADDSDGDGMPDAWESINHLNPASAAGIDGAAADLDGDGLSNLYEYWGRTNPHNPDTDADGVLDGQEDLDGDGLSAIAEQNAGSRPDMADTDDDGLIDSREHVDRTSPVSSVDPLVSRSLFTPGGADDYADVPISLAQRLTDWTLEAWVSPSNNLGGYAVRRVVQSAPSGQAVNYIIGFAQAGSDVRPYAGYVTPGGVSNILYGAPFPVGRWVHVAAAYSATDARLTLYTNGVYVATTNTFYEAPPINGKVGDAFLRIGESFCGAIDDVRIWRMARTGAEIQGGYSATVALPPAELVHYFRFDDQEANTNELPYGPFHVPGGAEDFTVTNDWQQQWAHAARLHGRARFINGGAFLTPPALQVIIEPAAARAAGARWTIDGTTWLTSGTTLNNLSTSNLFHLVQFMAVPGWTEPAPEQVELTNGTVTILTRSYLQSGSLSVVIQPAAALAVTSTLWAVDGGPWRTSGEVVPNLAPGSHSLIYRDLPNWIRPTNETITITEGAGLALIRTYNPVTGTIQAFIEPGAAASAGARWRVDGGPLRMSGDIEFGLALGNHTVSFSDVITWITPASQTLSVTSGAPIVVTGVYAQLTGLYVELTPPAAVSSGALWRVVGGAWTNSGVLLQLAPGNYTVEFANVPGWAPPVPIATAVTNFSVTRLTGTYIGYTLVGDYGSTAGRFNHPRGLAFDSSRNLYVADSDNHRVQILNTSNGVWSSLGSLGTAAGQFNQPFAVALDASRNLYVADCNNNRIQRRLASNGQWTTWGGPNIGTAQGQFNGPWDVTLDASANVYVADHYNNRVQRMTSGGAWSTFIANGFSSGFVRTPGGVAITPDGYVLAADLDATATNGYSRIQRFTSSGVFSTLLGDSLPANGQLNTPRQMVFDATSTNLYVADSGSGRIMTTPPGAPAWSTLVSSNVLTTPTGVALDPRGYLYVSDTAQSRIYRFALPNWPVPVQSLLVTMAPTTTATDGFVVTWDAQAGWVYDVQYAPDCSQPTWSNLPGAVSLPGRVGVMTCLDTNVAGVSKRTYRVLAR